MNNKIILPMEIINNILSFRPTHPTACIISDNIKYLKNNYNIQDDYYFEEEYISYCFTSYKYNRAMRHFKATYKNYIFCDVCGCDITNDFYQKQDGTRYCDICFD